MKQSLIVLLISLLAVPAAGQIVKQKVIEEGGSGTCKFTEPATEDTLWIQSGARSIYGVLSKPANAGKKQPVASTARITTAAPILRP